MVYFTRDLDVARQNNNKLIYYMYSLIQVANISVRDYTATREVVLTDYSVA